MNDKEEICTPDEKVGKNISKPSTQRPRLSLTSSTTPYSNLALRYVRPMANRRLHPTFAKHELLENCPIFHATWLDEHKNIYEGFLFAQNIGGQSRTNQQRMMMRSAIDVLLEIGVKVDANDSKKVSPLTLTEACRIYSMLTCHTEKTIRSWYVKHDDMITLGAVPKRRANLRFDDGTPGFSYTWLARFMVDNNLSIVEPPPETE